MVDRETNIGLILALLSLLVIGGLFIFIKPRFTGFVTNIIGENISSHDFANGIFESTKFDSEENAIALDNSTNGNYTSEIFDAGQEVIWNDMSYSIDLSPNSSMDFYIRSCDDANCDGESFVIFDGSLNVSGRYFQYKIEMQTTENSPKLYEVNISYSVPEEELYVSIISPEATTYNSGEIVVNISSNGESVWFNDGAENITYIGAVSKTFSEGNYTLTAWANNSDGNEISSSVTFTVLLSYCGDGTCDSDEDCSSCSVDCGECEETTEEETEQEQGATTEETTEAVSEVQVPVTGEVSSSSETTQTEQTPTCTPDWQCDEWSECIDGEQTRECNDKNNCGSDEGKPALLQSCQPAETCFDGIRNQDEIGIDCGGVCEKRCGFFTIVGNTIKAPVDAIREKVFVNKTRAFLMIGGLILLIGGIVVFEVFRKINKKRKKEKEEK